MRTEQLPNKKPEGYGPTGIPIDKDAPSRRSGVRLGANLTIMVDSVVDMNQPYAYVILWNTQTGERSKVYLTNEIFHPIEQE